MVTSLATRRALLARLDGALERAQSADLETRKASVAEAFDVLSALYSALDPTTSREIAAHVGAVYDTCLRALGRSGEARARDLRVAAGLCRALAA